MPSTPLCGAMVARLTPDQKAACSNHVRVNILPFCWNTVITRLNMQFRDFNWEPREL